MKDLLRVVEQEGIYLKYDHLDYDELKLYGLYFYDCQRNIPFIILDLSLEFKPILHRCVLAEELGHHFTVPKSKFLKPFASYGDRIELSRDERRALAWAARFLVSDDELDHALAKQYGSIQEIAEHLSITPEIAIIRLEIKKQKNIVERSRREGADTMQNYVQAEE